MTNYKICSQCSLPSASRDFQNNVEQKFSFHTDYILTTDGAIPYSYNTHHQPHKSGSGILVWSTKQNFPKSGLAPSVDKSMYINSCVLPVHALDNKHFGRFYFFYFYSNSFWPVFFFCVWKFWGNYWGVFRWLGRTLNSQVQNKDFEIVWTWIVIHMSTSHVCQHGNLLLLTIIQIKTF